MLWPTRQLHFGHHEMRLRRSKPEVSEEDRKWQSVRAQLEQITQEYKDAQEKARSSQKQLK